MANGPYVNGFPAFVNLGRMIIFDVVIPVDLQ
jgi:hypothetical protein